MLKTIVIALVVLLGAVLIYASTRPDHFRIERSIVIQSPPEKIFPLISDFQQWGRWSPWEKIDPDLKRSYSGASHDKGAIYEWSGNSKIGQGRMEIVDSVPPSKLRLTLDFITPFEAHNTVDFVLTPEDKGTRVTQTMSGPSPFVSKVMGLFYSMDKMVGEKYEEGLANLKQQAEK